jgi:putative inorganic carbon (hco3(-)) transporter
MHWRNPGAGIWLRSVKCLLKNPWKSITAMNIDPSYDTVAAEQLDFKRANWLAVFFTILALVVAGAIAVAVSQIGFLALLAIPVALIFAGAIVQPQLGLLALIVITVTQLSNVAITVHGLPSLAQPLAGLLLLVILIRFALYNEFPPGWVRIGSILGLFVLIWMVSLFHAEDFAAARQSFVGFAKDVMGGVIVIFLVQRPSSLRRAAWAFIGAGIVMGSVSVFQYLTGSFDNNFWGFGGWVSQVSGAVSRHRLTGPYNNPNAYAQVLVVILPLALDRLWQERRLVLRLLAGWAVVVCTLTVLFTYSRGGFLTLLFAFGVWLILRRPNLLPLFLTGILAIALLLFFLPSTYTERVTTLTQLAPSRVDQVSDPSFRGRLSENIAAWRMFRDHPILGVGLGNFRVYYQDYSREIGLDPRRDPRSPASLYMEFLSEQGLLGTALFLFLIILVFRGLLKAQRQFRSIGLDDEMHLTSALFAGLAAYLFASIFKNSAYANVFWLLMGFALATIQVAQASFQASGDGSLEENE